MHRTPPAMQPPQQDPGQEQAHLFPPDLHDVRHLRLKGALLLVWALVSFVAMYFARDLQAIVVGWWPLGYWVAAQGGVLVFIAIVVVYGWAMNRFERQDAQCGEGGAAPSGPESAHRSHG